MKKNLKSYILLSSLSLSLTPFSTVHAEEATVEEDNTYLENEASVYENSESKETTKNEILDDTDIDDSSTKELAETEQSLEENQEESKSLETDSDAEKDSENVNKKVTTFSSNAAQHTVISTKEVHYVAKVNQPWSINTQPWGTKGAEKVMSASNLLGETVDIVQEKVTERSTYALIALNGKELGWIDTTGLEKHVILSTDNVNYTVEVTKPWSINSQPWGIEGYQTVENAGLYVGEILNIIQEKKTNRSTYLLLEKNGTTIGWIDQTGVEKNKDILSVHDTHYVAKIQKPWSINTQPWGTAGAKKIYADSEQFLGKVIEVTQEKKTNRSTYALISLDGKELGWIDATGLEKQRVLSTKDVNYKAEIVEAWSINSQPWGIEGFKTNYANATEFMNQPVDIIQEKVTPRTTYALVSLNGKELGWIDKDALNFHPVLSSKKADYKALITKPWSINTHPWGTDGYETIISDSSYVGKVVDIVQEKTTPRSTYVLIEENGQTVGWIDSTGIEKQEVLSTKNVNYVAKVIQPWSINSQPWGTEGFETVVNDSSYVGKTVNIIQEKVTPKSTYVLIEVNGRTIGWIDSTGIEKHRVLSTKNVLYSVEITQPWSINTKPWGIDGYKTVNESKSYLGGFFDVVQEKKTQRSTYVLLEKNGVEIGWIDITGIKRNKEIKSIKNVNYVAKISKPWSINTEPWGTNDAKTIHANSKELLGYTVDVVQEKVTDRSTYALIKYNSEFLGWIDKDGLNELKVLSTKNTSYTAKIVKPWSINTQPWGTNGYEGVENSPSYLGKTGIVVQEKTTDRGTYALIEINGKKIGWIDKTGIKETKPVIYLDPGHGGSDPGASGTLNNKTYYEKDLNLQVSLKIRDLLEKQGYAVIMSRETDKTVGLYDRPKDADQSDATLFVSVHFNAINSASVNGIETFYYEYDKNYPSKLGNKLHNDPERIRESADLASEIHDALLSTTGAFNRDLKRNAFVVLRETELPAVLLELGFMTNKLELSKVITNDYQNKLARAVVEGINNYYYGN